jgi:hypothetical protein
MQMHEPSQWAAARSSQSAAPAQDGGCIDVTRRAPRFFCGRPVEIESRTFERFVAWTSEASRRLRVHLDEDQRLERMLQSSGCAAVSTGGCFICRAVDSHGFEAREQRHILTMSNIGLPAAPRWLIYE